MLLTLPCKCSLDMGMVCLQVLTSSRDNLNRHNVLEHDASMSRSDAYYGNNHVFNSTIFDKTKAYWKKPVLDATMLANGKLARQIQSRASNPNYTFTSSMEEFSLGEVAAPVIAFGDIQHGRVNRSLVEYFFGIYIIFFSLSQMMRIGA